MRSMEEGGRNRDALPKEGGIGSTHDNHHNILYILAAIKIFFSTSFGISVYNKDNTRKMCVT